MSDAPLGPLEVQRLSGSETFHRNGRPAGFDVLDFWRWSSSDLVVNVTRGVLAEYIVAKALAVSTERDQGAAPVRRGKGSCSREHQQGPGPAPPPCRPPFSM